MKRSAEAIWVEARNRWQINVQKDGKRKIIVQFYCSVSANVYQVVPSCTKSAVEDIDLRLNRRGFRVDGVEPGGVRLAFADGGGIVSHSVQVTGQDFAA